MATPKMTVVWPRDVETKEDKISHKYGRDSDGAVVALSKNDSGSGVNGVILLGIMFALTTILLLLVYFILFVYNRLRHPDSDLDDNEGIVAGDTIKSGVRSEGQNPLILTKEDLQVRAFQEGSKERAETDKVFDKSEQEPTETKAQAWSREKPSDAQSEGSGGSIVSGQMRRDLITKEELKAVDDGPEKFSRPPSDMLANRDVPGGELAKQSQQEINERQRRQWIHQFGSDYRQYLRREWRTGNEQVSHQIDYSKALWKK